MELRPECATPAPVAADLGPRSSITAGATGVTSLPALNVFLTRAGCCEQTGTTSLPGVQSWTATTAHAAEVQQLSERIESLIADLAARPEKVVLKYIDQDEMREAKDEADRAFRSRDHAYQAHCEIRLLQKLSLWKADQELRRSADRQRLQRPHRLGEESNRA